MNDIIDKSKFEENASSAISPDAVQSLARMAGIELSRERVKALMPQIATYLAIMHVVDEMDAQSAEPALEFHLGPEKESIDG